MTNFMEALAIFYPCTYCAIDFRENMKQSPIRYVQFDSNKHTENYGISPPSDALFSHRHESSEQSPEKIYANGSASSTIL
jgi:hypothetical protein